MTTPYEVFCSTVPENLNHDGGREQFYSNWMRNKLSEYLKLHPETVTLDGSIFHQSDLEKFFQWISEIVLDKSTKQQ